MSTFLQFVTTGLRLGSVYALIALGYTMVYGIIKLINFAHGDFIMVGGYTLFFTILWMMNLGLPGWLAIIPAIIVCACVGMLVELLAYRPVRKRGNNLTALITAIAMSFVLENLAQAIPAIGPDPRVPYTLFSQNYTIGGVTISSATIITIVVAAIVMIALYWFTQKTKTGRAMRCVSEDKEAAQWVQHLVFMPLLPQCLVVLVHCPVLCLVVLLSVLCSQVQVPISVPLCQIPLFI